MTTVCSRCGGSGKVTRGNVVNGVCYKCGGDGKHRPGVYASRRSAKIVQWVALDSEGHHLAMNTDRATLETIAANIPGFVEIAAF